MFEKHIIEIILLLQITNQTTNPHKWRVLIQVFFHFSKQLVKEKKNKANAVHIVQFLAQTDCFIS